jgi:hypothetical protein
VTKLSTERELGTTSTDTSKVLGPDGSGGVETKTVEAGEVDRFPGRILFSSAPTAAGDIFMRGWDIETDAAASLASGSPHVASEPGFNSRFALTLSSTVGAPFTLRLTGDTVDRETGAVTSADTDDVAVAGDGSYQSEKWFITAPSIVPVEAGKSATAQIRRLNYAVAGTRDYEVLTLLAEFTPDAVNWDLSVYLWKVEDNGSITVIDSFVFDSTDTPKRADDDTPGAYSRTNLSALIDRAKKEGVIIYVDQQAIGEISVTVGFEEINPTP